MAWEHHYIVSHRPQHPSVCVVCVLKGSCIISRRPLQFLTSLTEGSISNPWATVVTADYFSSHSEGSQILPQL